VYQGIVHIHDTIFLTNSAEKVSLSGNKVLFGNYLNFSLQFPAGHMQLTSTGRQTLNSTRVATKLGPGRHGECQLSFALLFSSIQALSAKRTFSNFRSNSRRGIWNSVFRSAVLAPGLTGRAAVIQIVLTVGVFVQW
jgi:hypothetical protein